MKISSMQALLNHIRIRPFMYVLPEFPEAYNFFAGMRIVAKMADIPIPSDEKIGEKVQAYGLGNNLMQARAELRARGADLLTTNQTLINIITEAWQEALEEAKE